MDNESSIYFEYKLDKFSSITNLGVSKSYQLSEKFTSKICQAVSFFLKSVKSQSPKRTSWHTADLSNEELTATAHENKAEKSLKSDSPFTPLLTHVTSATQDNNSRTTLKPKCVSRFFDLPIITSLLRLQLTDLQLTSALCDEKAAKDFP